MGISRLPLAGLLLTLGAQAGQWQPPRRLETENPIRFQSSPPTLTTKSRAALDRLADQLIADPSIGLVHIEAHAADGDIRYSIDPTRKQSRAVRDHLVERGVDPLRLEPRAYGESRPIDPGRTPKGRAKNRRVELVVADQAEAARRLHGEEGQLMVILSRGSPPDGAWSCSLPAHREQLQALGIPVGLDPTAQKWLAYFGGPGRTIFERWRERKRVLEPMINPLLEAAGLSPGTLYLAMIESGLNPQARSRLGALGLWQFLPDTASGMGLRVTQAVDQRRQVFASTKAAVRYLRGLKNRFGDWQLAWTAYNAGPSAVARALSKAKCRDFSCLAASGMLSPEAANYVPKVMAAAVLDTLWDEVTCRRPESEPKPSGGAHAP